MTVTAARPIRLAILLSHPVQYFAPVFRELAKRPDVDLTVIYCRLDGAKMYFDPEFARDIRWDTPLLDGYRHKVLRGWDLRGATGPLAYLAPSIMSEIKAENYDASIVFGWAYLTCWLAFAKARWESIPWVLYGDTSVTYEKGKRGLKGWLRRMLLRALFKRTSAFLTSGAFNALFYEFHGVRARASFDAPFAIDNELFSNGARTAWTRRAEIRRGLGIPPHAIVLLFVGKLASHKRPQDLLHVLENLRRDHANLAAVFVGDGPLRKTLESEVASRDIANVFFLGFRNQSTLPPIYAASDVLVLPSSREAKALVTNEAMACGLPVIVSDRTAVWGPSELVRDGENGFVFPAGDLAALTGAVRRLVTDAPLRERMGKRSREIVGSFTPARCAKAIVAAARFACHRASVLPVPVPPAGNAYPDERHCQP